jgi:glutamine amidotransferase
MGWNTTTVINPDPLLTGLPANPWFYFVHSYCAPLSDFTIATSCHGQTFTAIVKKENFYGAQFHPERSAKSGARLLANFMEIQ